MNQKVAVRSDSAIRSLPTPVLPGRMLLSDPTSAATGMQSKRRDLRLKILVVPLSRKQVLFHGVVLGIQRTTG